MRPSSADPRPARRAKKMATILAVAWQLARRDGLGALSLRDLASAVGLRQPSLYVYFASKADLYDAMFADGYRQLLDFLASRSYDDEPRAALQRLVTDLVHFSSADFVRHQLLFQRTIPGFEPSPESMALAEEFYRYGQDIGARAGITSARDFDLFTALVAGLTHQQTANDPGGDRWVALAPPAVEMLLDHVESTARGRRP